MIVLIFDNTKPARMPVKSHLNATWTLLHDVVSFCSFSCDPFLFRSRAMRFLRTLTVFDSCMATSSSESQLASMITSPGSAPSAGGLRLTVRPACPCRAV